MALVLLDPSLIPEEYGWRAAFAVGAALGILILVTRRLLPESPRWLMIHGRPEEAEEIVRWIERRVEREAGDELERPDATIEIPPRESTGFREIARTMVKDYPTRSLLGFSLMAAQAFFYNAVFFTSDERAVDRRSGDAAGSRRIHARLWGPGRFRQALRWAVASGRVRKDRRLYRAEQPGAG